MSWSKRVTLSASAACFMNATSVKLHATCIAPATGAVNVLVNRVYIDLWLAIYRCHNASNPKGADHGPSSIHDDRVIARAYCDEPRRRATSFPGSGEKRKRSGLVRHAHGRRHRRQLAQILRAQIPGHQS